MKMDKLEKWLAGGVVALGIYILGMETYANYHARNLALSTSKDLVALTNSHNNLANGLEILANQYNTLADSVNQCCPELPRVDKIEIRKGSETEIDPLTYLLLTTQGSSGFRSSSSPLPPFPGYGLFPSALPGLGGF